LLLYVDRSNIGGEGKKGRNYISTQASAYQRERKKRKREKKKSSLSRLLRSTKKGENCISFSWCDEKKKKNYQSVSI